MTSIRKGEVAALRTLVELHGVDGPAEWEPHHWDAAEVAASRLVLVLARTDAAVSRQTAKKAPKGTPTPPSAREAVLRRSAGDCEAQTIRCVGRAVQVHHRDRDRKNNDPVNLLHVCSPCHDRIHAMPALSFQMGWITHRNGIVSQPLYLRGDT